MALVTLLVAGHTLYGQAAPSAATGDRVAGGEIAVESFTRLYDLGGEWWLMLADRSPFREQRAPAPDIPEAGRSVAHGVGPEPVLFPIEEDWPVDPRFGDYDGLVWRGLRVHVRAEPTDEQLALLLPLHGPGAQVYWNGTLVRETRPFDAQGRTPHTQGPPGLISIPPGLVRPGENHLELRSGSLDATSGILHGFHFGPIELVHAAWTRTVLWYCALFSISLFLAVYNFLFYFQDRSELYYLYFAFMNLSVGLWLLGWHGLSYFIFDSYYFFLFCVYGGGIMTIYLLLKFIHSFLHVRETWLDRLVQFYYLGLTAAFVINVAATGGIKFFIHHLLMPYLQSMGLVILYMMWINIRAIRRRQPFARFFFLGLIVLLSFASYSTLVFLHIVPGVPPVNEGFFAMSLVFATVLARRYSRIHKDLEVAHDDLLVLDRMKDDFLATTSHELRTPLHGIMGLVAGIKDQDLGPINAEQKENLDLVYESARRLSNLVDDILNFSKIRAGKMDLFLEELALGDTIATVVSLSRGLIGDKPLRIEAPIPPDLPPVRADGVRIQQVLFNLVGNAIKYSERGTIRLEARQTGDMVEVSVADEGPGIPADQLENIWRPFEQLEGNANTRQQPGVGLGLAVTRELVEMHGGRIQVNSVMGQGSVFSFELPIYREGEGRPGLRRLRAAADNQSAVPGASREPRPARAYDALPADGAPPRRAPAREKRFHILAIDDDSTNLHILRQMLGPAGYETVTATSGPEGLEILGQREIDLILLDLMMPGMSGYEVCEKIRADYSGHLPILMLTARNELEDRLRGFYLGANDYLSKPFDKNELLARVENQLAIKYLLDAEQNLVEQLQGQQSEMELSLVQRGRQLKVASERVRAWEAMITEDMELAEKFQKRMLSFESLPGSVEFYDHYEPLLKIGGDIYNVFQPGPGRVRIFLADAAGHGINASLNTVKILSEYDVVKRFLEGPVDVLRHLADTFRPDEDGYMILFSAVVADIDLARQELRFASAGHLEQFLLGPPGDRRVRSLKPRGPLIGFPLECEYEEMVCDFSPGSILFLYTDGLINNLQKEVDETVIGNHLSAFSGEHPLRTNCEYLIENLVQFAGSRDSREDDTTILAVRWDGPTAH